MRSLLVIRRSSRLGFALLAVAACKDPVDQAAKKRIFSPEDPPQAIAAASQKLPPAEVADSPELTRRVMGMGAAEATERIGPHAYRAAIEWEWSSPGLDNVRLKETRELLAGRGGVSGDFHAKLSNSRDQGFEVLRVAGRVFARPTYGKDGAGKFRERKRDRGMAERLREEAYGAVKDFDGLFRGRLKLTADGTETVQERTAWKYNVTLADERPSVDPLPPRFAPKKGADETTLRRLAFFEARQPRALQGTVYVDQDTSVVLKTKLDGRLVAATDGGTAELHLVLDAALSNVGQAPAIAAPTEFLPDEDKPQGIAAAMRRFGFERQPDGGLGTVAPTFGGEAELPDDAD